MNCAQKAFTLIELLVVIAIIGILAAIILPVYTQAKKGAYRSSDMSNMNQIRTALALYRVDQGAYPPALLGYVTQYNGGPNPTVGDMIPASQVQGALYPKRISSLATLQPAFDRGSGSNINLGFVNPVWPNGDVGSTVGQQRFGPTQPVQHCDGNTLDPSYYYLISGYDVAQVKIPGGGTQQEIHYAPFWSVSTVPSTCNPVDASGDPNDNPRQLGYSDPPENTVVTWNSWFRDYDSNGNALHERQDIVLFLAGDARPFDSASVVSQAWKVMP